MFLCVTQSVFCLLWSYMSEVLTPFPLSVVPRVQLKRSYMAKADADLVHRTYGYCNTNFTIGQEHTGSAHQTREMATLAACPIEIDPIIDFLRAWRSATPGLPLQGYDWAGMGLWRNRLESPAYGHFVSCNRRENIPEISF